MSDINVRQAHRAAMHMTRRAFIRAYGEENVKIWNKMIKRHKPYKVHPWRFPDASIRMESHQ